MTAGHTGKQGVAWECHATAAPGISRAARGPRCQVEPTLVQSPRRRDPHNLIVPGAPKCAIVSHSTPAALPRDGEGRPQTPCRHRPAYAVDPRRRKGQVSRGGERECRAPSVVPAEAGTSQPSSLVIPAQAGIQVGEGAVMPSAAEASLGQLVAGAVAPAPLFPIPRAGVDRAALSFYVGQSAPL